MVKVFVTAHESDHMVVITSPPLHTIPSIFPFTFYVLMLHTIQGVGKGPWPLEPAPSFN